MAFNPDAYALWKDCKYKKPLEVQMKEAAARVQAFETEAVPGKLELFLKFLSLRVNNFELNGLEASMYELQEMMRDSEVLRAFHAPVDQVFYRGLHPLPIGKSLFDFMQNAPYELIEEFLKCGVNGEGRMLLHAACARYIHGDLVTYLLFQHFDGPSLLKEVDIAGNSPLHIACIKGFYPDVVKFLIKNGANVNATNKNNCTPIHYAAELGFEELIKILFRSGAGLDLQDNLGKTPLHYACRKTMYQSILSLVDAGADLSVFTGLRSPWRTLVPWRRVPFGQGSRAEWIKWVTIKLMIPITWYRSKAFLEGRTDSSSVLSYIPSELVSLFVTVFTDTIIQEFVACSERPKIQRYYSDAQFNAWEYEIYRGS